MVKLELFGDLETATTASIGVSVVGFTSAGVGSLEYGSLGVLALEFNY